MTPLYRSLAACLSIALFLPGLARADAMTEAKRRDIQVLMGVLNMQQMREGIAGQIANALANNVAAKMGKAPRAQLEKAGRLVAEESVAVLKANDAQLAGSQSDIIGNAFTADEVRQLVVFYQSPLGKKTQTALPTILDQSMQAGQQWAQGLGPQIEQRVVARAAKDRVALPTPNGKVEVPPPNAQAVPTAPPSLQRR